MNCGMDLKKYNFALYDNEKVYFGHYEKPVDNRFIGNTAIDYNGGEKKLQYGKYQTRI